MIRLLSALALFTIPVFFYLWLTLPFPDVTNWGPIPLSETVHK